MSWFDALCHAMSAVSLGGFSTHDASIAYFDTLTVEWAVMFFTLWGGVNFATHFTALTRRSLKSYWRDEECRVLLALLAGSILISAVYLWQKDFMQPWGFAAFCQLQLCLHRAGKRFSNTDFAQWPLIVSLWMFFLSICWQAPALWAAASKTMRALVLFKFSLREMMILLHPKAVRTVKVNGRMIPDRMALTVMAFISIYFMTTIVFSFC